MDDGDGSSQELVPTEEVPSPVENWSLPSQTPRVVQQAMVGSDLNYPSAH